MKNLLQSYEFTTPHACEWRIANKLDDWSIEGLSMLPIKHTHTHTHWNTQTHSNTHTHTFTHSFKHKQTSSNCVQTRSTHAHTHTHSLPSLTHTHSLTLSHSLSHTHTHNSIRFDKAHVFAQTCVLYRLKSMSFGVLSKTGKRCKNMISSHEGLGEKVNKNKWLVLLMNREQSCKAVIYSLKDFHLLFAINLGHQ